MRSYDGIIWHNTSSYYTTAYYFWPTQRPGPVTFRPLCDLTFGVFYHISLPKYVTGWNVGTMCRAVIVSDPVLSKLIVPISRCGCVTSTTSSSTLTTQARSRLVKGLEVPLKMRPLDSEPISYYIYLFLSRPFLTNFNRYVTVFLPTWAIFIRRLDKAARRQTSETPHTFYGFI